MSRLRLYGEVLRRMRRYGASLVAIVIALAFSSILAAAKPWPLKIVIDNVLRTQPLKPGWFPTLSRHQLLVGSCAALVLLYVMVVTIDIVSNYVTISIGQRMVNDF